MQFFLALGILLALGLAESAAPAPVDAAVVRALAAMAAVLSVPLLALVFAAVTVDRLQRWPTARALTLAKYDRLRQVQAGWWLCIVALTVGGLGWARLVRFNAALGETFLIDECLILAAAVVPWVLSLWAAYEVERALHRDADGMTGLVEPPSLGQYVVWHARQQLGLVLAPLLMMLAVQDAARRLAPDWLEGQRAWLLFLAPLALLLALFPLVLQALWKTTPLPAGALRRRLERLGRRTGFRPREILVWHTGGRVVNAAVTGIVPGLKYVLLSDGLLTSLSDDQIEAVYAHEIGHVRNRHLLVRTLAMLAPLGGWLIFLQVFPDAESAAESWLASRGVAATTAIRLLALTGVAAYVGWAFGWLTRRLEHQADRFAAGALDAEDAGAPAGEDRVAGALERLGRVNGIDRTQGGWQHPSIARRVAFLRWAATVPILADKFERRLAWVARFLMAVCLLGLATQALRGF